MRVPGLAPPRFIYSWWKTHGLRLPLYRWSRNWAKCSRMAASSRLVMDAQLIMRLDLGWAASEPRMDGMAAGH